MLSLPSFTRRRKSSRPFSILVILTLATMLLSPVLGQPGLAQDTTQQEQQDTTQEQGDPVATEVPPTEEPQPTDEIAPTEVPDEAPPTEVPELRATRLTVSVYRCDHPEFDPYFSENMQLVLDTCTGPGSGTFTVQTPGGEETQSGSNLTFAFDGDGAIREAVQKGYDDPIANCFVRDANGAVVDQIGPGETNGGSWRISGAGGDVHCDWYQIDRGLGAVRILVYACPSSVGLAPEPEDIGPLFSYCPTEDSLEKEQFFVVHGAGLERMGYANSFGYTFEAIQTGPVELWMNDPAGFDKARAFCRVTTLNGQEISPFAEVSVGSFRASGMTLTAGNQLDCRWFNIEDGPGNAPVEDPTAVPDLPDTESPTGSVAVNVHACPAGTNIAALNRFELAEQCQEDPGAVNVNVANPDFFYSADKSATGGGNYASFTDVVPGTVIISGPIPVNTITPVAYCKVELDSTDIVPTQQMPVNAAGSVSMPLAEGQLIWCDWYVVSPADGDGDGDTVALDASPEAGGPSRIVVQVSACADTMVDPSRGYQAVEDACGQRMEGVTLRVAGADGFDETKSSSNTGTVIHEVVPVGNVTITETIPDRYGEPIVYCQQISHANSTFVPEANELVPVQDGSITREVITGHDLTCLWFNVPESMGTPAAEGTGSITIVSYACPAGFDVAAVDQNPRITCPTSGYMEFDVDDTVDDGESYSLTTDSGGLGTLSDLPPDTYTISQFVPNGVTSTFTWDCYDTNTISQRTDPLAMGSVAQAELTEGMALRCDVFNVTGGSGRVVISTHGCGVDVPAYVLDYTELLARCSIDTGAIDFTLIPDLGGNQDTRTASNNPLTLASFNTVTSGLVSVTEKLPGGWGTPIVYCQVIGEDGTIVSQPSLTDLVVGETIVFDLEPGHTVGCDWFNVAQAPLEVLVYAYTCPPDYDAYGNADSAAALWSNCPRADMPITFTLNDGGLYFEERTTTATVMARWEDAPSGELWMSEAVPEGYGVPIVFCETHITDAENNRYTVQGMVEVGIDATVRYEAPAGQVVQCSWFNVPGGSGMVSFSTQACPPTLDIAAASRLELEQGCNEPIGTVTYTLTSGSFTDTTTQTDSSGYYADFPSIPSGDITAWQGLGSDYSTAVVYCAVQEGTKVVTRIEEVPVTGDRTLAYPVEAGQWLLCEWYLGSTPEGTITVTKWTCPEYLPAGQERDFYEEKCTQTHDGVDFTVTGVASSSTQTTANGGTARWTGIQPGLVTISEHIPEGYGQPVVFCTAPKMNRNFPVSNGTIEHDLFDGSYLTCDWYNIPLEAGKVIVHKGTCPEGTMPEHDATWYLTNCDQPTEGVSFTLTHGAGTVPGTTDATGKVEWSDLPLGPIGIQEHIPDGYGDPVVFCSDEGDTMFAGSGNEAGIAPGGYLEGELTATAKEVTCYWYNIPAGHAEVWIEKYTCPEGYDLHAASADPVKDCTEATNGIEFSLGGPAAEFVATTGDEQPGIAIFREIAPGSYTIAERVPDHIGYAFVWDCTGQRMGEQRPTPLVIGASLEIEVDAGERITCRWYNVPAHEDEPDRGRLTVVKYTCTTETYVTDLDCEIEEDGVTFGLLAWNGDDWEGTGSRTTDGAGRATWTGLAPGEYWLDEESSGWCYIASTQMSDEGNWLEVHEGEETVVHVYNCSDDPSDQGKVPPTPMKYPNTGVPPVTSHGRETP